MKRIFYLFSIVTLAGSLIGCNRQPAASADSTNLTSKPSAPPVDDKLSESKIVVPAGTRLRVALTDAVSSDKSRAGDSFTGVLAEPIVIDGQTVLEKGTRVRGRVVEVQGSGRVKGRASIRLTLTEIVRDGNALNISTKPYSAVAEATKKRDAAIIGGGAGLGAAIGALAGGGKGALIGAGIGAGAGTGTVLATKGKEIRYSPETRIPFTLDHSVEI
jgi:hypothetical protein